MTRVQFLSELYRRLSGLGQERAEQHLTYYAEMLADRMEEGMTEEEAVGSMEAVDTIARRILQDEGVPWQPPRYPDPPETDNTYHPIQTLRKPAWDWREPAKIGLWAVAILVAVLSILVRINGYRTPLRTDSASASEPVAPIEAVIDTGMTESASEIPADVHIGPDGLHVWDGEYEVAINSAGLWVNGADGETQFYIGPDGVEISGEYSNGWDFGAQG